MCLRAAVSVAITCLLLAGCALSVEVPIYQPRRTADVQAIDASADAAARDDGVFDVGTGDAISERATDVPGDVTCLENQNRCSGTCVDLDNDPTHCGSCSNVCPTSQSCQQGVCCPAGLSNCDGQCVDTRIDSNNCGSCSRVCAAGPFSSTACRTGMCVSTCIAGRANCDGELANGCEADLNTPLNCGGCSRICTGGTPLCVTGTCASGCGALLRCEGLCVDIQTNPNHCGGCGSSCPASPNSTPICVAGHCETRCNPGFHACGTACVSDTSPSTCGTMCTPCPAGANAIPTCNSGACGLRCATGFANCDASIPGCETDVRSNNSHCGACSAPCGTGSTCVNSVCTPVVCGPGQLRCSGVCVPSDRLNCGECGRTCPMDLRTTVCCSGFCVNTETSPAACGGCGNICPPATSCSLGSCTPTGSTCPVGLRTCGGVCISVASDATNCGACGRICAVGETCQLGACTRSGG